MATTTTEELSLDEYAASVLGAPRRPTNLATWRALRAAGWTVRGGIVYDAAGERVEEYDEEALAAFFGA